MEYRTITKEELAQILEKHKLWLNGMAGGERANLRCADLSGADLREADLRRADLREADLREADLRRADLRDADLRDADLRDADLRGADLHDADLHGADLRGADFLGADLDYSFLPLWCGSLSAHFDDRQLRQIAYHLVKAGLNSKNASEETKTELAKLIDFANGFHRAEECGRIEFEPKQEECSNG